MTSNLPRGVALSAVGLLTSLSLLAGPAYASPGSEPARRGSQASTTTQAGESFQRRATYPVYQNLPAGVDPTTETVSEISTVSGDGNTLIYTDAAGKQIGFLDITNPGAPKGLGVLSLATLGSPEDEPTAVAMAGEYVLVVVNTSESFTNPSGRLDVIRLSDRTRVRSLDLGGQPDSIALNSQQTKGIVAIENERDEEFTPPGGEEGDLPQLPAGFVQVLDLAGPVDRWNATKIPFTKPDARPLTSFVRAGLDTPSDPEPEYVSVNDRDHAAVTLQENNGVVIVDLNTKRIRNVFSAGNAKVDGVDAKDDGRIEPVDSIDLPREPDSIAWLDQRYVATANEGDWKGGTRGWSVFDSRSGRVVWDAGNSFEQLAIQHGYYNDSRADNKGPEPEGLAIATINGGKYAFVGSERANFVAVYDLALPYAPKFLQLLPATNGPEGILPIPSRNLVAISSEVDDADAGVRASVSLYELAAAKPSFPTILSDRDKSGFAIGWSALGSLSAKPGDPNTIYTAADNALAPSKIFSIDVSQQPARITSALPITDGGEETAYDIEGIFARPQGGFWIAVEGADGPSNRLVRTDAAGAVQEIVTLPSDIAAGLTRFGFEGITATNDERGELLTVVLQRPLKGETAARIGRYDVAQKTWTWFAYTLEKTNVAGDWIGLSEITAVGGDRFAVIERDKLNGPRAAVKRVYTIDLPRDTAVGSITPVTKKLAIDVLPRLRETNGWTQEKLEGLTIGANARIYAITDNDGVQDATGETVFLDLGPAELLQR